MSHIPLIQPHRPRRARRAAFLLAAGALALAACNRGDAADADSTGTPVPVTVGAENITVVKQDTLETGPAVSGTLSAECHRRPTASEPVRIALPADLPGATAACR